MNKGLKPIVREVLITHPQTRDNDFLLIGAVYSLLDSETEKLRLDELCGYARMNKLPSFESITRARRSWQRIDPTLRATEEVAQARLEEEAKYHEEYRHDSN